MKLMKVFQIETDYLRHKNRLRTIKSQDAYKKVSLSTNKNIDKINSYNRKQSRSAYFREF